MSAILKEEPEEITWSNRNVSPAFERVVNHCLEKDAAARFQSARDLSFALEAISGISGATGAQQALKQDAAATGSKRWRTLALAGGAAGCVRPGRCACLCGGARAVGGGARF